MRVDLNAAVRLHCWRRESTLKMGNREPYEKQVKNMVCGHHYSGAFDNLAGHKRKAAGVGKATATGFEAV